MKMKKFLDLFNISNYHFLKNEQAQFENYFMECLYDQKWSNVQSMLDNEFKPSEKNIDKMQNMLLQLIASDLSIVNGNDNIINSFKNKNKHTILNFMKLMVNNNLLDIDFLFKTQETNRYLKSTSEQWKNYQLANEKYKKDHFYKERFNKEKFEINIQANNKENKSFNIKRAGFDYSDNKYLFQASLNFTDNQPLLTEEDNILDKLSSNVYKIPLKELLVKYSESSEIDNKEELLEKYSKNTLSKNELVGNKRKIVFKDILESFDLRCNLIILLLPDYLIKKAIEKDGVKAEDIIERSLKYDNETRYIALSVLKLYPEINKKLSNDTVREEIKLINNLFDNFTQKHYSYDGYCDMKKIVHKYINQLEKNLSNIESVKDEIFVKFMEKQQQNAVDNKNYVILAKSGNLKKEVIEFLEQCQNDVISLRDNTYKLSLTSQDALKEIEKNIFKSLNDYLSLKEVNSENNQQGIEKLLIESIKECHRAILSVKDVNFQEKIDLLDFDRKKATIRKANF